MDFNIQKADYSTLPIRSDDRTLIAEIEITSEPDADALADGETDPFEWMDLGDVKTEIERLISPDEIVLNAKDAMLVLDYPLEHAAVRKISAKNSIGFTRKELLQFIDETYRKVYQLELETQPEPTPELADRGKLLNRPKSNGMFGIRGHDYTDLGVSHIQVYEISKQIWLELTMES